MPGRRRGNWQPPDSAGGGGAGQVVQRLRAEIEELVEAFAAVPPRLTDLDHRLSEIGMAMRDLEAQAAGQDAAVRDMAAVLKRLGARVEWLERNIRLQDAAAEADLDDAGPDEQRLAEIAEAGHEARAECLTASARSGLESAIEAHQAARAARTRHRQLAVEACWSLAGTTWTDPDHQQAAVAFTTQVQDAGRAQASVAQLAGPALTAAQHLADDDEKQRAVAEVVSRGEAAWARLTHQLRGRLAEAVGSGALLPAWFTGVLGPIPPPEDTRAWMEAGTALLAYRATYKITDPVLALGAGPGPGASTRRMAWHAQLTRQLRELQS